MDVRRTESRARGTYVIDRDEIPTNTTRSYVLVHSPCRTRTIPTLGKHAALTIVAIAAATGAAAEVPKNWFKSVHVARCLKLESIIPVHARTISRAALPVRRARDGLANETSRAPHHVASAAAFCGCALQNFSLLNTKLKCNQHGWVVPTKQVQAKQVVKHDAREATSLTFVRVRS